MSKTVESIYQSALLADAAYVNFEEINFLLGDRIREEAFLGALDDDAQSFSERGFSRAEFDVFRERYRVLQHQPDAANGFSATLFQDTTTGELHLAFRGTNDLADIFMDLALAVGEAYTLKSALQNGSVTDFLRMAGILDDMGGVRPEFAGRVHIVGHSLGGYLSTWTASRYPEMVSSVDTFNGAGLAYGNPLTMFLNTLWNAALPGPGFDRSRITHYYAEPGPEFTAAGALAFRPGRHVPLFIENQSGDAGNVLDNHSMSHLVDALGAYRVLALLDPSLQLGEMTGILESASNRGPGSIASLCLALGEALGDGFTGITDPVALHTLVQAQIDAGGWPGLLIEPSAGRELAALAAEDSPSGSAARFALQALHPFLLIADGTPAAALPPDAMSTDWIAHRALLLDALLSRNQGDAVTSGRRGAEPQWYADVASGIDFTSADATSPFPLEDTAQHRFGGADADSLEGGGLADGLFGGAGEDQLAGNAGDDALGGGAGDDTLSGGGGDDRLDGEAGLDRLDGGEGSDALLGGEGADTFVFGTSHGNDTVLGPDSGGDRVVIAGRDLATLDFRAVEPGSSVYRDPAVPGIEAQRQVDGLLLRSADGLVLLAGWRADGDFGISLREADARETGSPPGVTDGQEIRGDLAALDTDPLSVGLQTGTDALGNLLTDPAQPELRDDQLFGSAGGDRLLGGGGADRLLGRAGPDELRGDAGRDLLLGEDGDDWLAGGAGTDVLVGGAGADRLFAGSGEFAAAQTASADRDWLVGGDGDDTLEGSAGSEGFSGGAGADRVFAGSGDDQVLSDADIVVTSFDWGWVDDASAGTRRFTPAEGQVDPPGAGADTVHGGEGQDWLSLGRGADLGFGDAGDDTLGGHAGADTLAGGEGDDLLEGDARTAFLPAEEHGDDVLDGGAGRDSLSGAGGADLLLGGDGNDSLWGDADDLMAALHGADTLRGGAGDDWLDGQGGADQLAGGEGNDTIGGGAGDDTVNGSAGDDRLWGDSTTLDPAGDGNDRVAGEAGHDELVGGGGDDTLDGGEDDDRLWGVDGSDFLQGGAGADALYGGAGEDQLLGGAGDDSLVGAEDADRLEGGAGNDVLQADAGEDSLFGGSGDDTLMGDAGNDTLDGGEGVDELQGGDGEDVLAGGLGADRLFGDAGADRLSGDADADALVGGDGDDTLDGGAGEDTLWGGAGADVFVIDADGGTDLIADADAGDRLFFAGAEAPEAVALQHTWGDSQLSLHYAGTEIRLGVSAFRALRDFATEAGPVDSGALVRPTDGIDRVLLAASDDRLATGAGADRVMGGDGTDTLAGEDGDDELWGEAHADWLTGGLGADTLRGGTGSDLLEGGSGDDNLGGGSEDDTLDGGPGNDSLEGGSGNDTYRFGPGAGSDLLFLGGSGQQDRVLVSAGVTPADLRVRSGGTDDLYLELASGERLRVASFFASSLANTLQVHFEDAPGTVWDAAMLRSRVQPAPTEGNDTLEGFAAADSLAGAGGDDSLSGGLGNDMLQGDAGNDLLQGGEGADQLAGGAGSDTLRGGAGADTYLYLPGDGEDVLIERDVPASPDVDVLRFGAGVQPSQLSTRVQLRDPTGPIGLGDFLEQNLEIVHEIAGQGRVRVLPPDDPGLQDSRLEELRFEDAPGTVIRWSDTLAAMQVADAGHDLLLGGSAADALDAQAGDDLLWGADGNDALRGGDGRDSLLGGAGADTLDGGPGDDFLRGGNDPNPNNGLVDRYVWGRGYGHDTVWARPDGVFWTSGGAPFPADILDLNGLQWSEIRAVRSGGDLELSIPGTPDRLTVRAYFDSGHNQVRIRDGLGNEYRQDAVERKIVESAILAQVSAGDDTIIGSVFDDTVDAAAGNDRLDGREGNDTLSGADGNDTLVGAIGNDVLSGAAGNDLLDGGAGDDLLAGGVGSDDYRLAPGGGSDRILDQDKSTGRWDRIVVDGAAPSDIRVSRIGDELVLTLADTGEQLGVAKHFLVKGKDIGWHVDEVRFDDGSAWSRVMLLDFVSRAADGHWSLQGGAGADTLASLGGNDTLLGAAGPDTLRGGAGDDRLVGGPDADLLVGGSGADVYVFARGDGADTVVDEAGSARLDVLEFTAGIAPGDVLAYRAGESDLLLMAGGSDRVRITGFFDGATGAGSGIERIRFADGTEWRREDLQQAPLLPPGTPPQGVTDRVTTSEGQSLVIPVSALLANDRDADGDPLSLRTVTAVSGGTASLDPAGSTVTFTPAPYFSGAAAFDYLLSDGTHAVPVRVEVDVTLPSGSTVRRGTEGADSLVGTRGDDRLYGLGGNDLLRADRGNDVLSGGGANDTLEGGIGNDVYVFQAGDGVDVIDNRSARSGEIDVLQLTAGIERDAVWFQRQADDLLIGIGQGGDSLTVRGWYLSEPAKLDEIRVGSSVLYAAEVERLAQAMAGFAAPPAAVPVIGMEAREALEAGWSLPGEAARH